MLYILTYIAVMPAEFLTKSSLTDDTRLSPIRLIISARLTAMGMVLLPRQN